MGRRRVMDGNEAVASVAYRLNEVIGIYPITPASAMGELCDEWSAARRANIWGGTPTVVEMQSEGGAAGVVHGALQAGALSTSFTASQGLLLMLPNMYKIAGELEPCVLHVAARTVATHALSIFCDHSDVMACRQTGFAMLASSSVQEAHDFACIAQAATLRSRVPFLHFFDGFRTSHELTLVDELSDDDLRALVDVELVAARVRSSLSPDHPTIRGTAQNPDTFFQAREASNWFYDLCPNLVLAEMDGFFLRTGRRHRLFDYSGHPDADSVVISMGSAAVTVEETVRELCRQGHRVGALRVSLFRPFSIEHFLEALPKSVRRIAVLDRTKEPGATGEPLFLDVVSALSRTERDHSVLVCGGRYGLSSKEFTPDMVCAVFDELARERPKRRFTVGIVDDVSRESLDVQSIFAPAKSHAFEAVFYGLGSDGTVGANKSTSKIVGNRGELRVQGFFVYDSKKSGSVTVSHLRFGSEDDVARPYLISQADFVGCHQFELLDRLPVVEHARPEGTLLLNAPFPASQVWSHLSRETRAEILQKRLRVFAIDAQRIAAEAGLGRHINTAMQACFFALTELLPFDDALGAMKDEIEHAYAKKGEEIVARNLSAIAAARAALRALELPSQVEPEAPPRPPAVLRSAPDFVQRVTATMLAGHGDLLPVSAFPLDGTWPVGTSRYEKRRLSERLPAWDSALCIQCNKCVAMCPHAAIRAKVCAPAALDHAPASFETVPFRSHESPGQRYVLAVAPEDCTGCNLCVEVCPAKDKQHPERRALELQNITEPLETLRARYDFFLNLPSIARDHVHLDVKGSQFIDPLFEYSGACAGCGETPYLKLLTQLFGDRLLIANATGCSSIYGANLPTTPYAADADGRGPAWANSLFEDNAEFGLGMRLALDQRRDHAEALVRELSTTLGEELANALLTADQQSDSGIAAQRERVGTLKHRLTNLTTPAAKYLLEIADALVKKSVWIVGGDGWAYDIGFGGLDHVLASNAKVNVLVLDTEVYSNTGGQQSKATPRGAFAKFAAHGKTTEKKDLGLHAMTYGSVYVARVALGAKDAQTVRALREAEAFPGPSLVIAYCHCIAHGYDLAHGAEQQRLAVDSGVWPLFRFDPRRVETGEAPLMLDALPGKAKVADYLAGERRFRELDTLDRAHRSELLEASERDVQHRIELYHALSELHFKRTASS